MKKSLLIVLFIACVGFVASVALAAVQGSKHDLSDNTGTINTTGDNLEICAPCHTPHDANAVADVDGLIWNHNVTGVGTFTAYDNTPGNGITGTQDTTPSSGTIAGVSRLCLSCHDGTLAVDDVLNAPNKVTAAFNIAGPTFQVGGQIVVGNTNLGQDGSNDHPIDIIYNTAINTADAEMYDPATRDADALGVEGCNATSNTIEECMLFGVAGSAKVECASCHDVHATGTAATNGSLTRLDNTSSALCTVCHNK